MSILAPKNPLGASRASATCLARLADQLSSFTSVTILTGAGISTESGLSDYRSPERRTPLPQPTNHSDFVSSPAVRRRYWARSFVGYPLLSRARPGVAHYALAELHRHAGHHFRFHITQNVDGLLQAAQLPSSRIIELHGSIHHLSCAVCGKKESRRAFQFRLQSINSSWARYHPHLQEYRPDGDAQLDEKITSSFSVPLCSFCNADALMPTVVFHGGSVPADISSSASRVVDASDALLVVGTTLTPFSAFRLVRKAKADGKFVACINYGPTRADDLFNVKIEAHIGDALSRLADRLLVSGFHPPNSLNKFATQLNPLNHDPSKQPQSNSYP